MLFGEIKKKKKKSPAEKKGMALKSLYWPKISKSRNGKKKLIFNQFIKGKNQSVLSRKGNCMGSQGKGDEREKRGRGTRKKKPLTRKEESLRRVASEEGGKPLGEAFIVDGLRRGEENLPHEKKKRSSGVHKKATLAGDAGKKGRKEKKETSGMVAEREKEGAATKAGRSVARGH